MQDPNEQTESGQPVEAALSSGPRHPYARERHLAAILERIAEGVPDPVGLARRALDVEAAIAEQLAMRDMLADACGGAVDSNHAASAWDLPRYCEHIRDRQVAIVEALFELLPDQAEHLGQPYGDSFDAVEAALYQLELRAAILDRLIDGGHVTEALVEELEDAIMRERLPESEATP